MYGTSGELRETLDAKPNMDHTLISWEQIHNVTTQTSFTIQSHTHVLGVPFIWQPEMVVTEGRREEIDKCFEDIIANLPHLHRSRN